ncbi:hypothetical protein AAFP32_15145 [Brevibacterium sp. CBA3109]|uniref:Uncharacterized protein n=1 Tax=Brevibacterium koreense TaxID=3140787 RepID=A0AAU7ULM0_9MICO
MARPAQELISDSRRFQSAPSRLCEARFHLECGITTMFVGDLTARAQLHLSIGEHRTAAQPANRVLSQKSLDLHAKATARTFEAASLLGSGELVESDSAFLDALEYCRLTASLIPVVLVPNSLRDQSIQCSSSGAIAPVFANDPGSVDDPHVDDAHFAEGTVKNKPSNLYAHLGVRNRRDALARGYEYGYLPSVG